MANELIATGVKLFIGDAATTEAFTEIPGVVGIPTLPAIDPAVIDVTALDSTGAEKLLGIGDLGEFSVTINMRRKTSGTGWLAAQQTLEGYANDGILRGIRVTVAFGGTTLRTYNWRGFVKSFALSAPSATSAITSTVTITNSGSVTVS